MTKDEARARTTSARALRDDAELLATDRILGDLDWSTIAPGGTVTCYVAMRGEPPTAAVIAGLEASGTKVALPVMAPGRSLLWGWHRPDLRRNGYGVLQPEPIADFDLSEVDAMIIPAQRVGRDGTRLGRGAGYYDRALATVPRHVDGGPLRIALVFDDEVDTTVPHDGWDQPVDVIVTPARVLSLADQP